MAQRTKTDILKNRVNNNPDRAAEIGVQLYRDRSKPHPEPAFGRDDSLGEVDVNADGRKTVTTRYGEDEKGTPLYRTEEAAEAAPAGTQHPKPIGTTRIRNLGRFAHPRKK